MDLNSISQTFSSGIEAQESKLSDMLENVDPTDPVAMLQVNMQTQNFMTTLSLESTMQKDITDAVKSILQKM